MLYTILLLLLLKAEIQHYAYSDYKSTAFSTNLCLSFLLAYNFLQFWIIQFLHLFNTLLPAQLNLLYSVTAIVVSQFFLNVFVSYVIFSCRYLDLSQKSHFSHLYLFWLISILLPLLCISTGISLLYRKCILVSFLALFLNVLLMAHKLPDIYTILFPNSYPYYMKYLNLLYSCQMSIKVFI